MELFGFYISRTDWETKWWGLSQLRAAEHERFHQHIDALQKELLKYSNPRDDKGRFVSKQRALHDQLRAEVSSPTDWTSLKEAMKREEFGR
jgi:hypothetical protein